MGTIGEPCHSPFVSRKSYKKGIKGYTDASLKPIQDAFLRFHAANMTIVFIGDSTMRQKLQALDCEMRREHHRNYINIDRRGVLPCLTYLSAGFHGQPQFHIHGISIGPNSANCLTGTKNPNAPYDGVFENAKAKIKAINDEGRGVFILSNVGLWYNEAKHFENPLHGILEWLGEVADNKKVQNIVAW